MTKTLMSLFDNVVDVVIEGSLTKRMDFVIGTVGNRLGFWH